MGDVTNSRLAAQTDLGRAVYKIETLDTETNVERKDDGGVKVTLTVDANLLLDEMIGFTEIPQEELVNYLGDIAASAIRDRIVATFQKAQAMDADIYGFGLALHRHHKEQWHEIENDWDAIFQNIEFDVQVTTHLPSTGKVVQSIEMEEQK